MAPSRSPTFSAAVWMINRIHDDPTDTGTPAKKSGAARFPQRNLFMIQVADLTYSSHAL